MLNFFKFINSKSLSKINLFIFLLSLFFSILVYFLTPQTVKNFYADSYHSDYTQQVENIGQGHWFTTPEGVLLDRYPPIYPIILASMYKISFWTGINVKILILIISAVFIALSAILIYRISSLFFNRKIAFAASILFITHPYIVVGAVIPLSNVPFMFFMYLALYFLCKIIKVIGAKWKLYLLIGIILGFAMLTRPVAILLPIVFIILIIISHREILTRKIIYLLLMTSICIITIIPWCYQVSKNNTESRSFLSSGGVLSMIDGISFNALPFREKLDLPKDVSNLLDELYPEIVEVSTYNRLFTTICQRFKEQPLTVLKLYGIKILRCWYGVDRQSRIIEKITLTISLFYLIPCIIGIIFILSKKGNSRESRFFAIYIIALIIYFWMMSTLVLSIVRYMFPVFGLMVIFIPVLLEQTSNWKLFKDNG